MDRNKREAMSAIAKTCAMSGVAVVSQAAFASKEGGARDLGSALQSAGFVQNIQGRHQAVPCGSCLHQKLWPQLNQSLLIRSFSNSSTSFVAVSWMPVRDRHNLPVPRLLFQRRQPADAAHHALRLHRQHLCYAVRRPIGPARQPQTVSQGEFDDRSPSLASFTMAF